MQFSSDRKAHCLLCSFAKYQKEIGLLANVGMLQKGKCFPSDCHIQASQNVPPSFLAARHCCSLHKTQIQVHCKYCPICILRLLVVTVRRTFNNPP